MDKKGSCLARIPYNTVIGFIFTFVGGFLLCATSYTGFSRTEAYFAMHFTPIDRLRYLRIGALIAGVTVVLFSILVVVFATLVTGATRGRIYRGDRFIMGGRNSASMFICLSYTSIFFWLLFLVFLVVPTFCWVMFSSVCRHELALVWHGPGARRPGPDHRVAPTLEELRERKELPYDTYSTRLAYFDPALFPATGSVQPITHGGPIAGFVGPRLSLGPDGRPVFPDDSPDFRSAEYQYIFNLTAYGIYFKPWQYDPTLHYREAITTVRDFAHFCDEVSVVGPLFGCSLGGAIFIVLGLTLMVASLSAFYTKLKLTRELTEFKQSVGLRSAKTQEQVPFY